LHYIFEGNIKQSYLWITILAFNVALSLYWSTAMYNDWHQNPTLTTVVTSAFGNIDIDFPSITICPNGIYNLGVSVKLL